MSAAPLQEAAAESVPPAAVTDDGDEDCTICFEPLSSVGGAIPLPCDCKVTYCSGCWDRALAASMSCTGRGRCPSCRSAMRISFDADLGRLTFSRARPGDASEDNWRKRLYEEAKPLQIKLLREFGGQATPPAVLEALEGCREGSASSGASPSAGEESVSREVEDAAKPPRCVCGSRLTKTSVGERVLAFISEETLISPPPSLVEQLMNAPPINCDICRRQLNASGSVWTCENGRRTVLHAVAYDVCESCFSYHAHGVQRRHGGGRGENSWWQGAIGFLSDMTQLGTRESDSYSEGASDEESDWNDS